MIKIPLQRLRHDSDLEFHFEGSGEKFGFNKVDFPVPDADIQFRLIEVDHGYFLTGQLTGLAQPECHRCLTQFDYDLNVQMDTLIVLDDSEEFTPEDDIVDVPGDTQEIDLTDFIQDAIVLAFPVKILCKEDCQGLCAQCGTNLNESSCDCEKENIDPRWEKLKELNFEE